MSPLHFTRRGSGTPLLLVHGFLGGIEEWETLTDALAPSFDVIAVDLPGFGGSADAAVPAALAGYGDLLAGLLDDLGIERCIVFGHSLGSMIAQQFALDHGPRVERLVLYGAAATGSLPGRFETFDATIERFKRIGIAEGGEPIIASWFVAGREHAAFPMYRDMAKRARTDAAIATLRAISNWQVTERLGEIRAPALVIGGDRDRSTEPAEQYRLWRGLAQAQLCILPNCAHAAHLEQPEVFLRLLCRFLSER
jgi:2-hydroxy-6-oxonona-2,4-dienedioate hydrolase